MATVTEITEAVRFAGTYTGSFGFLRDMKAKVEAGEALSENMVAAILRCAAREDRVNAQVFAPKVTAEPVTEGMYRIADGTVFKVQKAVHGSGNLYAKRLTEDGFEYAPGAIRRLTLADKMTLDEAKAWGVLYGTCCVCGRTLTDETSIAQGIGPVCAGKGWW